MPLEINHIKMIRFSRGIRINRLGTGTVIFQKISQYKGRIMKEDRGKLSIIGCKSGRRFSARICRELERMFQRENEEIYTLSVPIREHVFPNGEVKTVIHQHIRGDDVYVVQCAIDPTCRRSVNDNLMALLTAINAAHQSDADSITAVLPYFPYSRQERKKTREGITASQVARFLEESGVDRVITLDIHAEAIAGFFTRATLDDLHASKVLIDAFTNLYAKEQDLGELVVVSPDVGSAGRARFFSNKLGTDMAIADKERDYSAGGNIVSIRLVGDVYKKDVLIVDDLIDTGGSIANAVKLLKEKGARDIYVAASFTFLNQPAVQRLSDLHATHDLKFVIGTDAVHRGKQFCQKYPWYREVSVATLFAEVIYRINRKKSVSEMLR